MYEAAIADDGRGGRVSLRELWDSGRPTIGGWCSIPSAFSAEVLACAGFEWICIDTQHGLIDYEQMVGMLQALDARGVPTLVRVRWNEPASIMKALDAGAGGVIVPMVNSADEAVAATRASRYPPLGFRSWGPVRAALGDPGYDPVSANRSVLCIPMVETPEGVEHVEEIVAVPGLDGILIGPYDLSLSSSFTVETPGRKPQDVQQIDRILRACTQAGIVAGIACGTADDVRHWRAKGFRMLQLQSDLGLLSRAATAIVADARLDASAVVGDGEG